MGYIVKDGEDDFVDFETAMHSVDMGYDMDQLQIVRINGCSRYRDALLYDLIPRRSGHATDHGRLARNWRIGIQLFLIHTSLARPSIEEQEEVDDNRDRCLHTY